MIDDLGRVLVIGAGPGGLAAAACLQDIGVPVHLVDRQGMPGGAYRRMYRGIMLASPARYNALPGLSLKSEGEYVSAPEYGRYLERYAEHHRLAPDKAEVMDIHRVAERFRVTFAEGSAEGAEYVAVVAATGMFDHPVRPSIEGLPHDGPASAGQPQVLHAAVWAGPEPFRGRNLLIIGGATSAVEIAEECGRAGLHVTISSRGKGVKKFPKRLLGRDVHDYARPFEFLPLWLLGSSCHHRAAFPGLYVDFKEFCRTGQVTIRPEVTRCDGRQVFFSDGASEEFDVVVLATGYQFSLPYLPSEVARTPKGHPMARNGESCSWPGLYFMGVSCCRALDSEFLRGIARDALILARRIRERLSHISASRSKH